MTGVQTCALPISAVPRRGPLTGHTAWPGWAARLTLTGCGRLTGWRAGRYRVVHAPAHHHRGSGRAGSDTHLVCDLADHRQATAPGPALAGTGGLAELPAALVAHLDEHVPGAVQARVDSDPARAPAGPAMHGRVDGRLTILACGNLMRARSITVSMSSTTTPK